MKDADSVSLTSLMEDVQVIHVFNICKPCRIWQICRDRPEMKSQCQTVVSVLAKLFSFSRPEVCTKCDNLVENKVEHIINYCVKNDNIRNDIWTFVIQHIGHTAFLQFMSKSSKMQICDLIAGFGQYITNDCEELLIKIINNIHKMFI